MCPPAEASRLGFRDCLGPAPALPSPEGCMTTLDPFLHRVTPWEKIMICGLSFVFNKKKHPCCGSISCREGWLDACTAPCSARLVLGKTLRLFGSHLSINAMTSISLPRMLIMKTTALRDGEIPGACGHRNHSGEISAWRQSC